MIPFYDPALSYDDNYKNGPFGLFADLDRAKSNMTKQTTSFFHLTVNSLFGIPAGPLLNSAYMKAAFHYGFDLCVYKTVRTRAHKSHPLPNVVAIHPKGRLLPHLETVQADNHYQQPVSISNSFGVPSFEPDIWQVDLAKSITFAQQGQCVIGSFQGTSGNESTIEKDYAVAARLVAEAGAPVLEANMSCPNEGTSNLLCFDFDKVERIVHAIKNAVPDRPLLLKLAYFDNDEALSLLLKRIGNVIDGFSTINTIAAKPVNAQGEPILGKDREISGVCGEAIRWAGLNMVQRLAKIRELEGYQYQIVGVGGVNKPEHYHQYITAGANAVMSATGAMWNPNLAIEIKNSLNYQ